MLCHWVNRLQLFRRLLDPTNTATTKLCTHPPAQQHSIMSLQTHMSCNALSEMQILHLATSSAIQTSHNSSLTNITFFLITHYIMQQISLLHLRRTSKSLSVTYRLTNYHRYLAVWQLVPLLNCFIFCWALPVTTDCDVRPEFVTAEFQSTKFCWDMSLCCWVTSPWHFKGTQPSKCQ